MEPDDSCWSDTRLSSQRQSGRFFAIPAPPRETRAARLISQASGRFFAIPGRRGNPAASGRASAGRANPPAPVRACRKPLGDSAHSFGLGGVSDPQDRDAANANQRKTQLRGDRRLGQRLRESDSERLRRLLLRATPRHLDVRKLGCETAQELTLAPLGFEQCEVAVGKRHSERDSRGASARADVDDRARRRLDQRRPPAERPRARRAVLPPDHRAPSGQASTARPRASARGSLGSCQSAECRGRTTT